MVEVKKDSARDLLEKCEIDFVLCIESETFYNHGLYYTSRFRCICLVGTTTFLEFDKVMLCNACPLFANNNAILEGMNPCTLPVFIQYKI